MRIAFVGTGGVALRHLGVLAPLPQVEIVGHVSSERSRADTQARDWGGAGFTRIEDLLEQVNPDAVWVCVTPDRHGPLEMSLIDRGVPFFIEKPLSADLTTAESIARRLEAGGPPVAVGYVFRGLDILPRVRQLLDERRPRIVLAAWHDSLPPPEWWRRAERSGGQVVEQATHLLDLARLLVGEADVVAGLGRQWPRADAPGSDVPDVSAAFLRFATPDGPIPGLFSATSLLRGRQFVGLQLVCEGRVLSVSQQKLVIETGQDTEEVLTSADPFLVEDQAFLEALTTSDPSRMLCSYADALRTHRLSCAVRDALETSYLPGGPTAVDR